MPNKYHHNSSNMSIIFICILCCQACKLEHEIDCYGNGSKCVAIASQCDGIMDCPNGKDESVVLCGRPQKGIHYLSFCEFKS